MSFPAVTRKAGVSERPHPGLRAPAASRRAALSGRGRGLLVTARGTRRGGARAKAKGRWAERGGRVSRLRVGKARGRARCPRPACTHPGSPARARDVTRGPGADLLRGACPHHPGPEAQGPRSGGRKVPPRNRALGLTSRPIAHRRGARPSARRAALRGSA